MLSSIETESRSADRATATMSAWRAWVMPSVRSSGRRFLRASRTVWSKEMKTAWSATPVSATISREPVRQALDLLELLDLDDQSEPDLAGESTASRRASGRARRQSAGRTMIPASSARISLSVAFETRPVPSVVRSRISSCMSTISPSAVSWQSISADVPPFSRVARERGERVLGRCRSNGRDGRRRGRSRCRWRAAWTSETSVFKACPCRRRGRCRSAKRVRRGRR